jgi:hypothetical protein
MEEQYRFPWKEERIKERGKNKSGDNNAYMHEDICIARDQKEEKKVLYA